MYLLPKKTERARDSGFTLGSVRRVGGNLLRWMRGEREGPNKGANRDKGNGGGRRRRKRLKGIDGRGEIERERERTVVRATDTAWLAIQT